MDLVDRYRPWFYAAAIYNVLWGSFVVIWPHAFFDLLGMPRANYPALFQSIGMIVGVYALGYWLIARDPARFGPFVYVGLLGKIFGPIGFLFTALRGELPWAFGWINVMNDIVWLPVFVLFALELRRAERTRGDMLDP